VVALVLGCGCASYTHRALAVREPLSRADWDSAEAFLVEEKPGGDGLPYLMELGLVQHYAGRWHESNATFQQAEDLVEELWTKSISRELFAFATSDETIDYDGEMWERVLVNYYRAMNYIALRDFEGALVECRKMNHKLKVYASEEDEPPTYDADAFAQWVTAMLYEAGGEISDSWVSLRLADQGYQRWGEAYGLPYPVMLEQDLVRLAEQQGYRDDADRYRARFSGAADPGSPGVSAAADSTILIAAPDSTALLADPVAESPVGPQPGQGEIILFWEEGFIPAKVQREIAIPIMKNEWGDNWVALAPVLVNRYYIPLAYSRSELEYLLRVALPDYPPPTPADEPGWAVLSLMRPDGADGEPEAPATGRIKWKVDSPEVPEVRSDLRAETELASDLNAIARQGLTDEYGKILLRTIARGLSKYALTRAAENENEIAGLLTNLFTAATEKADTRSWITLPNSIQVARLVVPPGTHDLELTCYGPDGRMRETVIFENVEVGANEIYFLSHRTF